MDPYINVCLERNYEFKKFDNYFFPGNSGDGNEDVKLPEIQKMISDIVRKSKSKHSLNNQMFTYYDSIVLCNLDVIFELSKVKYHTTMKTYDQDISFCELGGNSMNEYFVWRFYNSKGYGVMTTDEYKVSPLGYNRINIITPPLEDPDIVPKHFLPESDYMAKRLRDESHGGVDVMTINKKMNVNYIHTMVDICLKEGGNCIIQLFECQNIDDVKKLIGLISMFKKVALIKPLSSDRDYLVLIDKVKQSNKIDNNVFLKYLNNYFNLEDKKEELYYLNRANIHFCIY